MDKRIEITSISAGADVVADFAWYPQSHTVNYSVGNNYSRLFTRK